MEGIANSPSARERMDYCPRSNDDPGKFSAVNHTAPYLTKDTPANPTETAALSQRKAQIEQLPEPSVATNTAPLPPSFFSECSALIRRFLHKPYPGEVLSPGGIPRACHGAMHSSRAAMWISVLLTLRRQMGDPAARDFPAEQLPHVMKAALLHDSGREGDGYDTPEWEYASGQNCYHHLLAIGCSPEVAASCQSGITNKDRRYNKTLTEKLIHDADCLEVMRVRGEFHMDELDLWKDFKDQTDIDQRIYELSSQVRAVIAAQGNLSFSHCRIINKSSGFQEPAGDQEQTSTARLPASDEIPDKRSFEFADNPLLCQLSWLQKNAPELFRLYQESAAAPQEGMTPDFQSMISAMQTKGASFSSDRPISCKEPVTGKEYTVREPASPELARNEVLMTSMAGTLGLAVPETHLIKKDGRTFVISKSTGPLQKGKDALMSASPAEKAKLYLVAAVLGNPDIVGNFNNTQVDAKGRLVALDWQKAGEYDPELENLHKVDAFGSTVFELDCLRNPSHSPIGSPWPYCTSPAVGCAAEFFKDLTQDDIEQAVQELISKDTSDLASLVETLGPDTPQDRLHLQRTVYTRLAYLARRFPQCCQEPVTRAEQAAIDNSGVNGYSLPVVHKDIEQANLRFFQTIDKDNHPVTECWLKLKPHAARQLSDRLGIPPRYHRLFQQVKTYLKAFRAEAKDYYKQSPSPLMSDELRHAFRQLITECHQAHEELERDRLRFAMINQPENEGIRSGAVLALAQTIKLFEELATLDNGVAVTTNASIELPESLPAGLPVRVSSLAYERQDNTFWPLRDIRYAHAKSTAEMARLIEADVHQYRLLSTQLSQDEGDNLCIEWQGNDLTEKSFTHNLFAMIGMEGMLKLKINGHTQRASEKLWLALDKLTINVSRPDSESVQDQYLDELAEAYCIDMSMAAELAGRTSSDEKKSLVKSEWLKQKLQLAQTPRWEDYHRVQSGYCVFYRPDGLLDPESPGVSGKLTHSINCYGQGDTENVLTQVLHCGGTFSSLNDRIRMGIPWSHSLVHCIGTGGSDKVYHRYKEEDAPSLGYEMSSLALRRADLTCLPTGLGLYDTASFKLHRKRPTPDYFQAVRDDEMHEVLLNHVSLEEAAKIAIPKAKKNRLYDNKLSKEITHWPDGRLLDDALQLNAYKSYVRLLENQSLLSQRWKQFIESIGEDQAPALLASNPNVLIDGQISSLKNITVNKKSLDHIDFANLSLDGATFQGINFNTQWLAEQKLADTHFKNCTPEWLNIDALRRQIYLHTQVIANPEDTLSRSGRKGEKTASEINTVVAALACSDTPLFLVEEIFKSTPLTPEQLHLLILAKHKSSLQFLGQLLRSELQKNKNAFTENAQQILQLYLECRRTSAPMDKSAAANILLALSPVLIEGDCHSNSIFRQALVDALGDTRMKADHIAAMQAICLCHTDFSREQLKKINEACLASLTELHQREQREREGMFKRSIFPQDCIAGYKETLVRFLLQQTQLDPVSKNGGIFRHLYIYAKEQLNLVMNQMRAERKGQPIIIIGLDTDGINFLRGVSFSGCELRNCNFDKNTILDDNCLEGATIVNDNSS